MSGNSSEMSDGTTTTGPLDMESGQSQAIKLGSRQKRPSCNEDDGSELASLATEDSGDMIQPQLLTLLTRDIDACDVQLSLFIAAASSFRYDSCLSPFPPMYLLPDKEKDIKALQDDMKEIPPLRKLKDQLEKNCSKLSSKILDLLMWVLTGSQSKLSLRTISMGNNSPELEVIQKLTEKCQKPNLILEVAANYTDRWRQKYGPDEGKDECFYAFHGSRLDNWHSILHHGLQQHRSKTSLFGEGVYLSLEAGVCLPYSSRGLSWSSSSTGTTISCMAVASVRHDEKVKIHSKDPSRGRVEGSEGGDVPEKYVVVRNNELVLVRYLLVYSHERSGPGVQTNNTKEAQLARSKSWIARVTENNRMLLLLVAYGLLLAAVGLSNSAWLKRWLRKMGFSQ